MEKRVTQRITTRAYTRTVRHTEHACAVCGVSFWGGPLARYCSESCRNRASYLKHADTRRAERRARYQQQRALPVSGNPAR